MPSFSCCLRSTEFNKVPLFKTNTLVIHPRTQVAWSTPIFGGVGVLVSTCIQKMMAINHFGGVGERLEKTLRDHYMLLGRLGNRI